MSKSEEFCDAPPLVFEILRCEWKIDCITLSELHSPHDAEEESSLKIRGEKASDIAFF